jgi:hypothetical protein
MEARLDSYTMPAAPVARMFAGTSAARAAPTSREQVVNKS